MRTIRHVDNSYGARCRLAVHQRVRHQNSGAYRLRFDEPVGRRLMQAAQRYVDRHVALMSRRKYAFVDSVNTTNARALLSPTCRERTPAELYLRRTEVPVAAVRRQPIDAENEFFERVGYDHVGSNRVSVDHKR